MEAVRIAESLAGVDRDEWNALAGPQPFVRHEYLSALIETGCASPKTGWAPQFVLLSRAGRLEGAMPLFAKSHSYGEYVFDWAWADAHERNGIDYYPKVIGAIPFTPVRGARILARSQETKKTLIRAALELAKDTSSLHILFARDEDAALLEEAGFLMRRTVQFHWRNDAYRDFEDFLARMSHARRKNIRQERRRVREAGVVLRVMEGNELSRADWEFFNRCYRGTYAAHRSTPYLNLEFFLRLPPEHVVMVLAEQGGKRIAASLLIRDDETLYGRYWGAVHHVPLLHFECCYYQPIEYAISRKLQAFEGGAQGEHKLFRGLMPVQSLSAHWLAHPRFAKAVENFLERETLGVEQYVNELVEHSPFKEKG